MPVLVHITDEKNAASILRSGLRLPRRHKAIYFMPVLQSHFISHQWIRELRRGGAKVLVGVYFRMSTSEYVWAGRYNHPHQRMTLGKAIRELRLLNDPLGFELFVDRPVGRALIQKIRTVPQGVGWRYRPHAHGQPPCGCPACMRKGEIKSRVIRERFDPEFRFPSLHEVQARLLSSPSDDEITDLLSGLRRKRRQIDPKFLEPLAGSPSASVREDVALTLPFIRHPDSETMLKILASDEDANVSGAAKEGLRRVGSK